MANQMKIAHNFFLIAICLLCFQANGRTSDFPPKSEFHNMMADTAIKLNQQMSGVKVDDWTSLTSTLYSDKSTKLFYFYRSRILQAFNVDKLTLEQAQKLKKFHLAKTCSLPQASAMPVYDFKIEHVYSDEVSGREIYRQLITYRDCWPDFKGTPLYK
jgi:hypothetical protein